MTSARYDRIGTTVRAHAHAPIRASPRRSTPRSATPRTVRERRRRHRLLRTRTTGSSSRVEPSATMIAPASRRRRARGARRRRGAAVPRRVRSTPRWRSLTMHHWHDLAAGLAELRRVARRQVLFFFEPSFADDAWIVADYFPRDARARDRTQRARHRRHRARISTSVGVEPVPVPADCIDGFGGCFWNRPEAYLDPVVQAGMSCFAQMLDPSMLDARHGPPRAPSSRRARGTRRTATSARSPSATSATGCSSPADVAGLRLDRADACASSCRRARSNRRRSQLFEDADLAVVRASDVDYRATIDDPRVVDVHDPAAAGDPALRRRRPVRRRHHRPRLDRGDRRRRRHAHRSCTTRRRPPARSASCSRSPATARGSRSKDLPDGVRVHTEYPELTRRFLEKHGVDAEISLSYGATEAKIPEIADAVVEITETRPRAARRRPAHPRHDPRLVHRADRQPDRVRRPREAQGDGAAPDAAHRRARSAWPRAREAQRRRARTSRRSSTCCRR